MSSLIGIGGGAGVVLAGVIVDHLSYHWLFWPLVAIVLAAIATHRFVPESPVKTPGGVNWTAAVLMSVGLSLVLVAVSETSRWGWGSAKTLGLIAGGLVVLAGWVAAELRSDEPLVDMRMMRIRGVWTTNLVAVLVGVGMYSSFILLPQFVQEPTSTGYGFGASVIASGLFLLPSTIAMVLVGQVAATFLANDVGAGNLPTNHGYALAFGLCAAALVAGVVAGLAIPSRGARGGEGHRSAGRPGARAVLSRSSAAAVEGRLRFGARATSRARARSRVSSHIHMDMIAGCTSPPPFAKPAARQA